ncbi:hypothetical protein ATZ33_08000 [Enterococcus silesiacus]|uniref:Replication-relaxation n=1 Tax=Enterococcus silesiacus TaxID=332949 RepID=A0A0S3KAL7_9ENTE|nr:replication-relaxation family protein [Enterococcus silesiacus]ALS01311.1 hypothetical protein ATZ33_08000 [Enterococcus silesiacus]OJG90707.1 hypothetical protein RV15_GL001058 [Enterococcus silesiacus]
MNDKENKRISKPELRRLSALLDSHEIEIVQTINQVKFITANQLQRLYFTKTDNRVTNLRRCNRKLRRLKNFGLIADLPRQVGGRKSGSNSTIWAVSSAGYQLLRLDDMTLNATRKRLYEPNILFLEHTLAITETYTRLHEMNQKSKIHDLQVSFEPQCWRSYMKKDGVATFLKPDLFARFAVDDETEDFVYYELDQATQAPSRVVRKCKQFLAYYKSGIEMRVNGVLPWVVWITPSKKRREQLTRYIHEAIPNAERIFRIITMEELETLTFDTNKEED